MAYHRLKKYASRALRWTNWPAATAKNGCWLPATDAKPLAVGTSATARYSALGSVTVTGV